MIVLLLGLAVLVGLVWAFLSYREEKREAAGKSRLSGLRLAFGTIALITMIFSGGCSLLFMPAAIDGDQYVQPITLLIIGGIPFFIGLLVWWVSMRRNSQ
jgi:hypothetical protein